MSQAITTSRELRNKETQIDISVPDYHEVPGLLTNDEVFHVIVISSRPYFKTIRHKRMDTVQFMVEKKYGEFEALHKALSDRFPATIFPELPRKVLMLKDSTPHERRASFDNFMKFVASNPKVASSSLLLTFLGVKPEKISQVEQMALDEAEAAKSDIIKKEEKTDEADGESQPKSQYPKKHSIGLFDDIDANEDLDLFEENSIREEELMKGILEESDGLFSSSTTNNVHSSKAADSSIFSNERDSERGTAPALFEAAGDNGDDLFLPPGATDVMTRAIEGAAEAQEDYSDLLNIDENLDQLILDTSHKPKKPPKPSVKPSLTVKPPPTTAPKPKITLPKPTTAPKPGKTPPKPKPRLSMEKAQKPSSAPSSKRGADVADSGGSAAVDKLGDEDILKYIQENESAEEPTLDLF